MDDDYIVEAILAKRRIKQVTEYLVKWEGYDEEEAEWITEAELSEMAFDEMNDFNKTKDQEKKEAQAAELKKLQQQQMQQNKSPNSSTPNSPGGLRNV